VQLRSGCESVTILVALHHLATSPGQSLSVHPLAGEELRMLRRLRREPRDGTMSSRGTQSPDDGSRCPTLALIGEAAWLVHPYQLRHGCGYKLPNGGRDTRALQRYLGHRNIQHPTRSTELVSGRFEEWQD